MEYEIKIEGDDKGYIKWRTIFANENETADTRYINSLIQSFVQSLKERNGKQSNGNLKSVLSALLFARHDLASLHGSRVTDLDDVRFSWEVNNKKTIDIIDEAIAALDKAEHSHT